MRRNQGITLIALVITIIVLLILAGVSIATLTGENGILTQAQKAKENTELSSEKEGIELAAQSSMTKNPDTLEITKINLDEGIKEQLGNNREFETTDNRDGSFLVNMNDTKRMYYIDETGEVIDQSKMLKIGTADELKYFRDDVNSGNTYEGWYIYLANDILLDINEEWEPIGLYPMENSTPNAETNKPFSGIFDGHGYKIDGIYINTADKVQGLFGLVYNGKVLNLGIGENCNITGDLSIGAIAGYLYDYSSIVNCYNKSNVKVGSYSGGIVGQLALNSMMENCYNTGKIYSNSSYIGGLVGCCDINSKIRKSYNANQIGDSTNTASCCGGIVGLLGHKSLIEDSYNVATIFGDVEVGGIAGRIQQESKLKNCYSIGTISGTSQKGDIFGKNRDQTAEVKNCYSKDDTFSHIELGNSFKEDTNNINNGYPILTWQ